jgi:hypothetical protein
MSTIAVLISVAALVGLALALFRFHWGALAIAGFILALGGAAVLQGRGFGILAGVAVIVGSLVVSQLAYLIGTGLLSRLWRDVESLLAGDEPDDHPGEEGDDKITGKHDQNDEAPPRSHEPND